MFGHTFTPQAGIAVPMVKVQSSIVQTLPNVTLFTLAWDTALSNLYNMWNVGAAAQLFAQQPGNYDISAQVEFASNAVGRRAIVISATIGGLSLSIATSKVMTVTDAGATTCFQVYVPAVFMGVGDYVTCVAFQASGGNLNVSGGTNTWFAMEKR